MQVLPTMLQILHIAAAATWFGVGLTNAGDLRRALAKGRSEAALAIERIGRAARIATISGIVLFASGLALVFAVGGFAAVSPRIHAGMGLFLVLFLIELLGVAPAQRGIAAVVLSDRDLREADGARKRYSALLGANHLLWFIILGLMIWRY